MFVVSNCPGSGGGGITVSVAKFGQLVIGPPGSGKSTYCDHMAKLLTEIGRKVAIVNLGRLLFCSFSVQILNKPQNWQSLVSSQVESTT
jgi:ABC-type iron transport system FetAB ATPase subunit